MKIYNNYIKTNLKTTEQFEGEPIEEKVARIEESGAPIEAISPEIFTEMKNGRQPQYDIRTDKWEIAQDAMYKIAQSANKRRTERIEAEKTNVTTPSAEPTN